MTQTQFVTADAIRSAFSQAMSDMYRTEVPAYGTLLELVAEVNDQTLEATPGLRDRLAASEGLERISDERHGAIRLGTAEELATIRRIFAVMGMYPVGYYDLTVANVPVHSTAFRPISAEALSINPFRVFTSLLRLDLLKDAELRDLAGEVLAGRRIFTQEAMDLTAKAEAEGGLDKADAARFVQAVLETFRWHDRALVSAEVYHRLHDAHRLIADVVSFRGPHINHLTPRTLDIDRVQEGMPAKGIAPKAVVEGPPTRTCPIFLRQTSFKALEEVVSFHDGAGSWTAGSHTARFGEIEQRGAALTPKGRALYDSLLNTARGRCRPAGDGSNADEYRATLAETFTAFPDDWEEMRKQGLAYFSYRLTDAGAATRLESFDLEAALAEGLITCDALVYEDFLPVSAAGIFQSNLGDDESQAFEASPNQKTFEEALGAEVLDMFEHYASLESASIERCERQLTGR